MERPLPGFENYLVGFDENRVWCRKADNGRVLANNQGNKCNRIMWKLVVDGKHTTRSADSLLLSAFPEVDPGEYLYTLYRGVKNRKTKSKRRIKIADDILLEVLVLPTTYCLTLPLEFDVKRQIKQMFPGPFIRVECEPYQELYFRSDFHMVCVEKKLKEYFCSC